MLAASLLPSLPSMWRGESMWSRAVTYRRVQGLSLLGQGSRGQVFTGRLIESLGCGPAVAECQVTAALGF